MTIEEALRSIRDAGACFVTFDAKTGEVLDVQKRDAAHSPAALLKTLGNTGGPVKGRFFDGATVTLQDLQNEVSEARRVEGRVATFSQWAISPPDELVQLLEADEFAEPMDNFHGPTVLIDRLFGHPPDVVRPFIDRLERVAQSYLERGRESSIHRLLVSELAVLTHDFPRLKAAWKLDDGQLAAHPTLLDLLGNLRPPEPEAIEILIRVVSWPGVMMFTPLYAAMVALGKVGAPAGPRAAAGIRATIFDSSPFITSMRELVLSRIETPERDWQPCSRCYLGRVPGQRWSDNGCEPCLGLGFVRIA